MKNKLKKRNNNTMRKYFAYKEGMFSNVLLKNRNYQFIVDEELVGPFFQAHQWEQYVPEQADGKKFDIIRIRCYPGTHTVNLSSSEEKLNKIQTKLKLEKMKKLEKNLKSTASLNGKDTSAFGMLIVLGIFILAIGLRDHNQTITIMGVLLIVTCILVKIGKKFSFKMFKKIN